MSTYSKAFAKRLRDARKHRGWSQAQLADRVNDVLGTTIDASTISRIESPESGRVIKLDEAAAAAAALDVPLASLLNDQDPDDEELWELERALELARYRADQVLAELEEARASIAGIEHRVAELKAARRG